MITVGQEKDINTARQHVTQKGQSLCMHDAAPPLGFYLFIGMRSVEADKEEFIFSSSNNIDQIFRY